MFSQHPPFANVISHYQPPGPGHYIAMPKASKTKRWEWMLAAVSRSPSKCDEIHRAFFPPTGKFEFEEEKVNEIITKMDSAAAEKTITKEAQTWWRNQSSEFEKEMKKEGGKKDGGKRDYNRDTHLRNGEKSRELIQLLINRYLPNDPSRKNPLVMDPFAGTLSVACVCADRADPIPCLSIDLDPYVLYKGAERLRKVAGKLIDTSIWLEKLHLKVKNSSLYHLSGSGSRMSDAESPVPSCDGEKVGPRNQCPFVSVCVRKF